VWCPLGTNMTMNGEIIEELSAHGQLRELNIVLVGDSIKISVVQFVPSTDRYVQTPQPTESNEFAADDSNVDLADRIRTALGPIIQELDLPRIHVMAEQHHVLLHGEVTNDLQAKRIEELIEGIPGVRTIESHLHVGLLPGDTRPSKGHHTPPRMADDLMFAAKQIGLEGTAARCAISAAVRCIFEDLPAPSQDALRKLLPSDISRFTQPNIRRGDSAGHFSQRLSLCNMVAFRGGITFVHARVFVPLVIEILRSPLHEHHELSRKLAALPL
jgi:BON domain